MDLETKQDVPIHRSTLDSTELKEGLSSPVKVLENYEFGKLCSSYDIPAEDVYSSPENPKADFVMFIPPRLCGASGPR